MNFTKGNMARIGRRALLASALSLAAVLPAQAAGAVTTTQLDPTVPEYRSFGRLFMTKAGGVTRCSAGVVDAPNHSTIITAGHCLDNDEGGVATSARFVPGYHDGVSPFGEWTSFKLVEPPEWAGIFNKHFDYGFIVLARNAQGTAVQDAVGALPIAFNQPRQQSYRVFGYPSAPNPPYDAEKLWACDTTWHSDVIVDPGPGPLRLRAECDFGVGSSGGPWLGSTGAVASVNSSSFASSPTIENGPYLGNEAASLFATAGSISTVPPPVATKKCKKKKRKHRALVAKKKCKKKKKKRKKR